jgi:hypothetical protein
VAISPQTDPNFEFKAVAHPAPRPVVDLGPLAELVDPDGKGVWEGQGFNTIWRPHPLASGHDRFLELNLTSEKLEFTSIPGAIPNRGLLMPDINMFGLTYMQQIEGTDPPEGLHVEPGIWAHVPQTSDPDVPPTVVRMASIPHGTTMLAQGKFLSVEGGPQIAASSIVPFAPGQAPPPFAEAEKTFTELDLAIPSEFRQMSAGVTEAMLENPNSVLVNAIQGQQIKHTTVLIISTKHEPVPGGGTANTAFLEAGSNPPGGNAVATEVDAVFWIETVADPHGGRDFLQLQYTQTVQLLFNGLSWPHVSVATLTKAPHGADA